MYAIIRSGGKQYRVTKDDVITVDRLDAAEGEEIAINDVLLVSSESGTRIGTPFVEGAKVVGQVVKHAKGRKIRGFTYKPKKDVHRHFGHRQLVTSLRISNIEAGV